MKTYAFILGRKGLLSIAELTNTLSASDHIVDIVPKALIAGLNEPMHRPQDSLDRLGGTVKIVEIFNDANLLDDNLTAIIADYLAAKFDNLDSKLPYGLSAYNFSQRREQILKNLLTKIKKNLKSQGINSRFINKNFTNLKTASIIGEKLLDKGSEIVLIQGRGRIYIGKTVAIQDIENYSQRDIKRPCRDARLGMLPPKLAQMMINLGGTQSINQSNNSKTVYDPFAGIGTVLMEGMLMGYKVIGSDINPEVIKKTEINLKWLFDQQKIENSSYKLFVSDATKLQKKDLPHEPDLIVTESYLGPPQSRLPSPEEIKKNFKRIEEMAYRFLKSVSELIKPGTPIVMSTLTYKNDRSYHYINSIPETAAKLGYKVEALIPKEISDKFNLTTHRRKSLIYDRPDQTVAREIFKFIKK